MPCGCGPFTALGRASGRAPRGSRFDPAVDLRPADAEKVSAPDLFPDADDDEPARYRGRRRVERRGRALQPLDFGRQMLAWQLRRSFRNAKSALQVLASSGQTLEEQQRLLAWLKRRPEILIIYCGHNEILRPGRFRARHALLFRRTDCRRAWTSLRRAIEAFSPLCGLIRQTAEKCQGRDPAPARTATARSSMCRPTPAPSTQRLLADFRRRLEAIVAYAERIGALPVLISPPGNDAGYEPNRSFLPAGHARARARVSSHAIFWRRSSLEAADPAAAQAAYRASDRPPRPASPRRTIASPSFSTAPAHGTKPTSHLPPGTRSATAIPCAA